MSPKPSIIFHLSRWLCAAILAPVLFYAPTKAEADGSAYRICNEAGTYLGFSYIYRSGLGLLSDQWSWKGFFELQPGKCGFMIPTHDAVNAHLAVFAASPGETSVWPRILGPGDIKSNTGGARISQSHFCPAKPQTPIINMPLTAHGNCAGPSKIPYTVYWTGLGQTHAEVNRSAQTLTITGVGIAGASAPPGDGLEKRSQAAFDLLQSFAARSLTLTRGGPCAIHVTNKDAKVVTLDLKYLDPTATTFWGRVAIKFQMPGAGSVFDLFAFGKSKRPEEYQMGLNVVRLSGYSDADTADLQQRLRAGLRDMTDHCAAQ